MDRRFTKGFVHVTIEIHDIFEFHTTIAFINTLLIARLVAEHTGEQINGIPLS